MLEKGESYLMHHGVKGQKWGVRRYQNYDGSLTSAGRERYGYDASGDIRGDMPNRSSKNVPKDMLDDAKAINGGKNSFRYGYNRDHNCAFCSMSYELRRRGEDVRAQAALRGVGNADKYFSEVYTNYSKKNTKEYSQREGQAMHIGMTKDEYSKFESDILKNGDNSRGILLVNWRAQSKEQGYPSGGHALNYEVKDGKLYLVDSQVGEVYSGKQARDYMSNAINVKQTRTDNLKMSKKTVMKKFSEKNVGEIKINNARKAARTLGNAAFAIHGLNMLSSPFTTLILGNPGFIGVGAGVVAAMGLAAASGIADKIADKSSDREAVSLQTKWNEENRKGWY